MRKILALSMAYVAGICVETPSTYSTELLWVASALMFAAAFVVPGGRVRS